MPTPTRAKRGTRPLLNSAHPELVVEATDPATGLLSTGSNKRVEWQCSQGHRWIATPYDRAVEKTGCPYCSGRLAIAGQTDLATTHPAVAAQVRDLDPQIMLGGSPKRIWWRCTRGHEWLASVANRALRGSQCPYCVGRLPIPGETDLGTTHPMLAAQLVDADPAALSRGSSRRVRWQCELGHTWEATPNTRVNMRSGCPYCSGQKVLAGFNDLGTRAPALAVEVRDIDPSVVSPTSKIRLKWECSFCSRTWQAAPVHRSTPGCPSCHRSGFKVTELAHIYLLHRVKNGRDELKVGITNSPKTRLVRHRQFGWSLLDMSAPMPGDEALRYEQAFLRHLDQQQVPRGRARSAPEPGFTESWFSADYNVDTVAQILDAATEART